MIIIYLSFDKINTRNMSLNTVEMLLKQTNAKAVVPDLWQEGEWHWI